MVSKAHRHHRILELLEAHNPASQYELQELLGAEGITANQATLSRDLHALGVSKSPHGYVLTHRLEPLETNGRSLERTLRRELLSADHGGNMVVLHTDPGHANPLAVEIDHARLADVLGTVAGDDTILVITKSTAQAKALTKRLRTMAGHR